MAANKSRVMHRSLRETPPKAVGGDGVWLIAEDGHRILDSSGGAAVSCLGHQHPRILAAIGKQASKIAYAHTGFFPSLTGAIAVAQSLAAVAFTLGGAGAKRKLEETEGRLAEMSQYFVEKG